MINLLETCLISLCLVGCAVAQPPKLYPLPESDVRVIGDRIYYKDVLLAELRYFFSSELSKNSGESYLFRSTLQHRGLAIFYYKQQKIVWIYPKRGLEDDIKRGVYTAHGQSDGYWGWVYDVSISPDCKYVFYKTPGLFIESRHKYLVEYGISK
jgi:hypothetical protein